MSLFKTEDCPICGIQVKPLQKTSAKYDGRFLCRECAKSLVDAGYNMLTLKKKPLEELQAVCHTVRATKEQIANDMANFNITRRIGEYLYLDEGQRKIGLPIKRTGSPNFLVYDYEDIISYEIIEDGSTVATGGLGSALIGEALFGTAGAIAGGTNKRYEKTCNHLEVKVNVNNIDNPMMMITLLDGFAVKKTDRIYKTAFQIAQNIASTLEVICHQNEVNAQTGVQTRAQAATQNENAQDNASANGSGNGPANYSVADEIRKFKELLDMGAITQEEFDAKKKELL